MWWLWVPLVIIGVLAVIVVGGMYLTSRR